MSTTAQPAVQAEPAAARPQVRRKPWRERTRRVRTSLLFLTPAIVLVLGYRIWPFIQSIRLSFTEWDGVSTPIRVGLENYRELWQDDRFWQALANNGKLVLAVPLFVLVPFLIAAGLQTRLPGWSAYRAIFFFPTLLSPAVVGLTFKLLLAQDGPLNTILRGVGLGSQARLWLQDPDWAMICVIAIALWAQLGIGVVIFMAAMGNVDPNLVDAAKIDGAGWWRIQRHVVFWQLLPIIELATVVNIIATMTNFFPLILLMTNGGPEFSTTTSDLFSYQQAFGVASLTGGASIFRQGYGSAIAVVVFVITVVFIGIVMTLFHRARHR